MSVPVFQGNGGFNAPHSPMGAYFSFTCGHGGTRGGMGVEMGRPAEQDIFVGFKEGNRYADMPLVVMPFFDGADKLDPAAAFLVGGAEKAGEDRQRFAPIGVGEMERFYGWGTDRWKVKGGLEFSIYTPFGEIPEPPSQGLGGVGSEEELKKALVPAVAAEVWVDNREGSGARTGFFAINFREGGLRLLELEGGRMGIGFRRKLGFAVEVVEVGEDQRCAGKVAGGSAGAFPFIKWWPHEGLEDRSNPVHLLGTCGGFGFEVPAGKHYALRIVLACHVSGVVTTRLEGRYFYNRYFSNVEGVLNFAGPRFSTFKKAAAGLDKQLLASGLSADQQFLMAQATRSYYANTQLLEVGGEPYWIVNEGEYRMMNTLDLAADQVFWELERNPWVVRNLLDGFVRRYSYVDSVKVENSTGPGGISFCHDQGTHNQFSPFGQSAYELPDLTGCFSYMTQEQLCNWILIAASYVAATGDRAWARRNVHVLIACVESMDVRARGARGLSAGHLMRDSALCGTGAEITTYDSLDASLGQARRNVYILAKRYVALLGLGRLLDGCEEPGMATMARAAADEAADRLRILGADAVLPAVDEPGTRGHDARILPIVEPLVFLGRWDGACDEGVKGIFAAHLRRLLADEAGRNRFADGGIRLSSTSENSWLSKIALVQHVARSLFNLDENGAERAAGAAPGSGWERADAAHVRWLTTGPGAYWCACDQMVGGVARGSKSYPRLITTALWLRER